MALTFSDALTEVAGATTLDALFNAVRRTDTRVDVPVEGQSVVSHHCLGY